MQISLLFKIQSQICCILTSSAWLSAGPFPDLIWATARENSSLVCPYDLLAIGYAKSFSYAYWNVQQIVGLQRVQNPLEFRSVRFQEEEFQPESLRLL